MRIIPQRPVTPKGQKKNKRKDNDRPFLDWLKTLICAKCGGFPPNDPAHYRTASNSGIATKPLYSAIPLCRDCHQTQHRIGTFAFMPRDEWERLVAFYVGIWRTKKPAGD